MTSPTSAGASMAPPRTRAGRGVGARAVAEAGARPARRSLLLLGRSETGRPTRHRSIHAALDWSERLLTPQQATAFARLSVFVGGFSLEGAEAVLRGADEDGGSALELVTALVTRSLLIADTTAAEARYRLLEPVRQYAADHLRAAPTATRCRCAAIPRLSRRACRGGGGADHRRSGPALDAPPRLRAGQHPRRPRVGVRQDHETASRLATALLVYCRHRGLYSEGAAWARQAALSSAGALRARALCMEGWL